MAVIDFLWAAVNARRRARGEKELDMLELYAWVAPKVPGFVGSLRRCLGLVGHSQLGVTPCKVPGCGGSLPRCRGVCGLHLRCLGVGGVSMPCRSAEVQFDRQAFHV